MTLMVCEAILSQKVCQPRQFQYLHEEEMCVCLHVCGYMHASRCPWRLENNFQELALSFYHGGPRDEIESCLITPKLFPFEFIVLVF